MLNGCLLHALGIPCRRIKPSHWQYANSLRIDHLIDVKHLRCDLVLGQDFLPSHTHPDAEQPLKAWYEEVVSAAWTKPSDIKERYRSASILKNRRVVFNIKGNDYRLVVAIAYKLQIV